MPTQNQKDGPLRLGVLISGGGSTLENLIKKRAAGQLSGVDISLVISSRDGLRGVEIASTAQLPLKIIKKRDYPKLADFSDALVCALDAARVDLVVMAGYLCLWQIPDRYNGRVLNIHPALLPHYGGKGMYGHYVHQAVLAGGETESGCSVHLADNQYDHGPLIEQVRVPVLPNDTPETLAARVGEAERELYPRVIRQIAAEGIEWLKQQAEQR